MMLALDNTTPPAAYFSEMPTSSWQQRRASEPVTAFSKTSSTITGAKIISFPADLTSDIVSIDIREYSPEYSELTKEFPWVSSFFQHSADLQDVESLLPYYQEINTLLSGKKFKACNSFIRQVKVKTLSDVLLVGLLRLTYNWKSDLPAWNNLLERSRKELDVRKHDSSKLLIGLI